MVASDPIGHDGIVLGERSIAPTHGNKCASVGRSHSSCPCISGRIPKFLLRSRIAFLHKLEIESDNVTSDRPIARKGGRVLSREARRSATVTSESLGNCPREENMGVR
jgi:hypothetical protein